MEWVELKLKNYRTKEPLCRRGRFGESHGAMGVAAVVVEPCREMGRGPRRGTKSEQTRVITVHPAYKVYGLDIRSYD